MTEAARDAQPAVLRNALWLVGAQVLAAPLSMLVNAVVARYLGPADFGNIYLATTYAGFALLFIEWGQFGALTGKIASHRARAGELLGSAIVWRIGAAVLVTVAVLLACRAAGYGLTFLKIMALTLLMTSLTSIATAGQDAVRGFERTDFAATTYLGQQLLVAVVSIIVLLSGLGLFGFLFGQVVVAAAAMLFVLFMLPRMQIPRLHVRRDTVLELFRDGRLFLTLVIVVQLQPLVDGIMMSRFASADSLGWFAASRKLIGVLVFPVTAVGKSLYPTLVRQIATDRQGFRSTLHGAIRALSLVVFPVALGCALFPQLGVMIFSATTYAPAEQNVRVLAVWLFLLYFSMPLSQCIMALGRNGIWACIQFGCVIISAIADPLLISWFQAHGGNGGLGVCVATAGSEVLMLVGGVMLVPADLLGWSALRLMARPALAGVAMAVVGLLLTPYNIWAAAALALLAYALVLFVTGALSAQEIRGLMGTFRRKPT